MEIRFSENAVRRNGLWKGRTAYFEMARYAAGQHGIVPAAARQRGNAVRFTLPGAGVEDHDKVIASLFELDPDAVVRTARAVYEGKADFESQRKGRTGT